VDNSTTQLSSGALVVKDGGITPSKLSTGGPSWTSGGALTSTSIQNSPIGSTTASTGAFTTLSASGTTSIYETIEKATLSGTSISATVNVNLLDGAVFYFTSNAGGLWTLNVRGNSGTTLNAMLATNDSISFVVMATQGATGYYQSAMQIDGNSVVPNWAGGAAPTAGNALSIDVYAFTIIKTGSSTYSVLASQTRFA
jgi:hypothetical protein